MIHSVPEALHLFRAFAQQLKHVRFQFEGTVRGTSYAGNTREYLLDTPLGPIKAEAEADLPVHELGTSLKFDLPPEKAARLEEFG